MQLPIESVAAQFTVYEIDKDGNVELQPRLSAQEEMARQIGQLWEAHGNFQGLSDVDSDTESMAGNSSDDEAEQPGAAASTSQPGGAAGGSGLDAYAVRAKVHEQLTLAQSEIQVSLDVVRLLLAAKKRSALEGAAQASAALVRHDQARAGPAFAALVGGDVGTEVFVGGQPFPVGVVDTVRTERRSAAQSSGDQQINELKFVLGAKYRQLGEAADTLERSANRLRDMARGEASFWRMAFALRHRNWVVMHQRQLIGPAARRMPLYGDRYFVRYGYADAGSLFAEDALAEVLRPSGDDSEEIVSMAEDDSSDVVMHSPADSKNSSGCQKEDVQLYIPSSDRRRISVRLLAAQGDELAASASTADSSSLVVADRCASLDRAHARLLAVRHAMFDRELFYRLCKEARVLDLGSVRAVPASDAESSPIRDVLVTALSRDSAAVSFEWMLDSCQSALPAATTGFAQWQGDLYAGLAPIMAAMRQRRLHCEVKQHQLGSGLGSRVGARAPPPDAFVNIPAASQPQPSLAQPLAAAPLQNAASGGAETPSVAAAATVGSSGSPAPPLAPALVAGDASTEPAAGTAFAVARPDLLILEPVLQSVRFAQWQHILAAHTQRACAAWRQLVGEPIEVISQLARTYQAPEGNTVSSRDLHGLQQFCGSSAGSESQATGAGSGDCMAYVIRMRFQGGSVMAFRVDSLGNLAFVKGYFPPPSVATAAPAPGQTERPDQILIHRVFRIIPLAGLAEFVDQLRREIQSLALLRVAAALSRCRYQRDSKRCQMGQWYVHQAQLCVVGEWWEGARHRQIIGVARWGPAASPGALAACGLGDAGDAAAAWGLSLRFGPKHPTVFDVPAEASASTNSPRIPWTTSYPPLPDSSLAQEISQLGSFEDKLFKFLVSSF